MITKPRTNARGLMLGMSAATVLVTLGAGAPAYAQSDGQALSDISEVVVTARKRAERLRDVPVAGTVLDATALNERAQVETSAAIVNSSPGARFNDLGTSTLSEVSIRSSGTSQNTNADTPTGLYANGVYVQGGLQFSRNFARIDFFDLERAEVLRGTLGALLGRNAVGGAVNLISAKPVFNDYSGKVLLDWGPEISRKDAQVISNLGVSDTLAFRIGLDVIEQNGGNFKNTSTGEYFDEWKGYTARVQARYANGPFDATLLVQTQNMHIPTASFRINIARGAAGFPLGYTGPQFNYPQNGGGYGQQDLDQVQFSASYDLGWAELSGTVSNRVKYTRFFGDQDGFDAAELARVRAGGNPAPTQAIFATQNLEDDTSLSYADVHIVGDKTGKVSWLAGVELLRTDTEYNTLLELTGGSTNTITPQSSRQKMFYLSKAYYGSIGYDLTDTFNVTGELRYTDDHKRYRIYVLGGPTHTFPTPPVLSTITQAITLRTFDKTNVSYNLTASWKFADLWMAYGKVGTGYRPGGFNSGIDPHLPNRPLNPTQPTYGPETTISYEAGIKGNLLPNLYVTLTGYRNITEDVLAAVENGCAPTIPQCPVRGTTFLINAGEARTWGVEAEASLRFDLLGGNGSLTGAASRQEGQYHGSTLDGREVPQSPDWITSANLYYQHPVTESMTGFMNWSYHGQWGGKQNTAVPPLLLDDYQLVDVRAGVRFGQVELAGYVNNVFDERYKLFIAPANFREAPPATYGLQLRYTW